MVCGCDGGVFLSVVRLGYLLLLWVMWLVCVGLMVSFFFVAFN